MNPSIPPVTDTTETLRWSAKRRAALALDLIRGKTTAAEASRQHGRSPRTSPNPGG